MSSTSSSESLEWLTENLKLEAMTNQWKHAMQQVAIMQEAFLASRLELAELRAQNQKLHQQLNSDQLLVSSGVSVIAALLWKASDCPKVIGRLIKSKPKLKCLFKFFHQKLQKYKHLSELYQGSSEVTDLILSLSGFLVNLFASRDACNFALLCENGQQLLVKISELLEHLDETSSISPSQTHLKSIFLMILYNISLETLGFQLIKDNKNLITALSKDLVQGDDQEVRVLEARILYSVMCQDDGDLFNNVKSILTSEVLNRISEEMHDSKDCEAKLLIECLSKCLNDYKEMMDMVDLLEETQDECMPQDALSEDVDENHMAEDCIADVLSGPVEDQGSSLCCSLCFDLVQVK